MIDVSKHITMQEATQSAYASAHDIKNEPGIDAIKNMQHVAQTVFEPLRAHFGVPIRVNSFYRSAVLNKAIGGAATSQHVNGQAMDLDATGGIKNRQVFYYILKSLPFDQLIWEGGTDDEPAWVHVSLTQAKNRYQVLRARKNSAGKMMYEDITKQVK
jgi:hypothetical protein